MTDVVEAMARGMWEASDAPAHVPYHWDGLAEVTRERMRQHARAAIRACHAAGGLVVGKMPGEQQAFEAWAISQSLDMAQIPLLYLFLDLKTYTARQAWKAALAAVRAAAVEVE